jgi:hypothetical protein
LSPRFCKARLDNPLRQAHPCALRRKWIRRSSIKSARRPASTVNKSRDSVIDSPTPAPFLTPPRAPPGAAHFFSLPPPLTAPAGR